MPVGAVDQYAATQSVRSPSPQEVAETSRASLAETPSAQPPPPEDVVSISPEASAMAEQAEQSAPKDRSTAAPDMGLTRALDGVDMAKQEASAPAEASEPQTRTTDPSVLIKAALSG